MGRASVALKRCWSITNADERTELALLERQLSAHFRITPSCVIASMVTGTVLLASFWDAADGGQAAVWFAFFVLTHLAWMIHARESLRHRTARNLAERKRELHASSLMCLLAALTWCAEAYLVFCVWKIQSTGLIILVATCFPAMMTTGMLVGFCVPVIASIWMGVMTLAGCLILFLVKYEYHVTTIGLLVFYATVLMGAVLFTSRMFVARIRTELDAEHEHQVVGLLLGDFEENANDWLWESDSAGVISRANPRLAQVLGRPSSDMTGVPLVSLFEVKPLVRVPSDSEVGSLCLRDRLAGNTPFGNLVVEARVDDVDRSWQLSAKPLFSASGIKIGWRGVGSEVTDARAREAESIGREERLRYLATHDTLTQLPNRLAFLETVGKACNPSPFQAEITHSALAFIDLDNFKAINDALGHGAGDRVLKNVAERLRLALEPGDFLARLGGDEFAILMRGLPGTAPFPEIGERARRVLGRLRVPESIDSFRVDVRGSIGITRPSAALEVPHELMRKADIALYAAKNAGRDTFAIYEEGMGSDVEKRLSLISDIALALERDEFEVVYQCIVNIASLEVVGYEALVRWHHPAHGSIDPEQFIPAAEDSGLIVPLGKWVLEQACKDAACWRPDVVVSVNVSAVQLGSPGIVDSILESVRGAGLPPGRVELEITESTVVHDDVSIRKVVQQLRSLGFKLVIDDFGTGHSSMAQLLELPFDKLKLDRSFVAAITGERGDVSRAIISALLQLGESLHLPVTAEGVETEVEARALRELGCQYGQGYLFSYPQSQADVLRVL